MVESKFRDTCFQANLRNSQNTAKKYRLIWRGCVMIFELKSCLHVNFIPWLYIHGKKLWNFSKWRIFSNTVANFFPENMRFCKYQLILWPDLKNSFFSWYEKKLIYIFLSSIGSEHIWMFFFYREQVLRKRS